MSFPISSYDFIQQSHCEHTPSTPSSAIPALPGMKSIPNYTAVGKGFFRGCVPVPETPQPQADLPGAWHVGLVQVMFLFQLGDF